VARLPLLARVDLLLGRHVLLAAYAEVALDGTTAHRATIEFTKTRSAYAGVPAGQQSARQRKELANDAQLLAGSVPQGATLLIATLSGCHQGTATASATAVAVRGTVVAAWLSERQCRRT